MKVSLFLGFTAALAPFLAPAILARAAPKTTWDYHVENGTAPVMRVFKGNGQYAWPNGFFFDALTVVIIGSDGIPIKGVSVSFSAPGCGFTTEKSGSGITAGRIFHATDGMGRAAVYCRAPNANSVKVEVTVSIEGKALPRPVFFSGHTVGDPVGKAAPGNPEFHLNADEKFELNWTDEAEGETGYVVERIDIGGAWRIIAVLQPNSTQFIDPQTAFLTSTVSYRVTSTGP